MGTIIALFITFLTTTTNPIILVSSGAKTKASDNYSTTNYDNVINDDITGG